MTVLKTVVVSIAGKEYSIRGDADEAYIRKLAKYVDNKIKGLAGESRTGPTLKEAIMTALQIADELHQIRGTPGQLKKVGRGIDSALSRLEEALGGS